jgi:hypothetical protein
MLLVGRQETQYGYENAIPGEVLASCNKFGKIQAAHNPAVRKFQYLWVLKGEGHEGKWFKGAGSTSSLHMPNMDFKTSFLAALSGIAPKKIGRAGNSIGGGGEGKMN